MGATFGDLFYVGYLYNHLRGQKGVLVKPKTKKWSVLYSLQRFSKAINASNVPDPSLEGIVTSWTVSLSGKYKKRQPLSESDAEAMKRQLDAVWDHYVNHVLKDIPLYREVATDLINPVLLKKGVSGLLGEKLYLQIGEEAKRDLEDALSCIRVGLWTPAVMITLRAVEDLLRAYHKKLLGRTPTRTSRGQFSWGRILNELYTSGKIKAPLMGYLNFLRDRRNEADHPGKRFSQDVAERTLIHGVEALKLMQ